MKGLVHHTESNPSQNRLAHDSLPTHRLSDSSICGRLSADVAAIPMILNSCQTYQELRAQIFLRFGSAEKDYSDPEAHDLVEKRGRTSESSICGRLSPDVEAIPMILKTCTTYQELWAALFYRFGFMESGYGDSELQR